MNNIVLNEAAVKFKLKSRCWAEIYLPKAYRSGNRRSERFPLQSPRKDFTFIIYRGTWLSTISVKADTKKIFQNHYRPSVFAGRLPVGEQYRFG
jgi:hypothetical protein